MPKKQIRRKNKFALVCSFLSLPLALSLWLKPHLDRWHPRKHLEGQVSDRQRGRSKKPHCALGWLGCGLHLKECLGTMMGIKHEAAVWGVPKLLSSLTMIFRFQGPHQNRPVHLNSMSLHPGILCLFSNGSWIHLIKPVISCQAKFPQVSWQNLLYHAQPLFEARLQYQMFLLFAQIPYHEAHW